VIKNVLCCFLFLALLAQKERNKQKECSLFWSINKIFFPLGRAILCNKGYSEVEMVCGRHFCSTLRGGANGRIPVVTSPPDMAPILRDEMATAYQERHKDSDYGFQHEFEVIIKPSLFATSKCDLLKLLLCVTKDCKKQKAVVPRNTQV